MIRSMDESSLDEHRGYRSTSAAGNAWLRTLYAPQYCGTQFQLVGRASGPVDWDCDGSPFWVPPYSQWIDEDPVAYDVNGDGSIGTMRALPSEWAKVDLGRGRIGR